jgi:anti-sigma regulatory factor (Ser/Thr protein kinase)
VGVRAAGDGAGAAGRRGPGSLHLRRPARAGELAGIRHDLAAWLDRCAVGREDGSAILVAINEAATNAVEHAFAGAPDPPVGVVDVEATAGAGTIGVVVRDDGTWHGAGRRAGGGRGIGLMARFMDVVEVHRHPHGTEVRMRRRLDGEH